MIWASIRRLIKVFHEPGLPLSQAIHYSYSIQDNLAVFQRKWHQLLLL